MIYNKLLNWKKGELIFLFGIWLFIIVQAFMTKDSPIAMVSALCGITYTFIAGKGNPICYLFGITGSSFYCVLSFNNALWGNLLLYALYYIPMQTLGYFQWNKNLQENSSEIVKIRLPKKELLILILIMLCLIVGSYFVLTHYKDAHPVLDSVTTVLSIGGMYLTVRRAIEQWIFWLGVNILSLIMWINIALSGVKVYSTVIMWAVYTLLAVYFYIEWKKELDNKLC
jgi:nicotinamide mononucleotide transporter